MFKIKKIKTSKKKDKLKKNYISKTNLFLCNKKILINQLASPAFLL